ncbi:Glycosyltransferase involved in cell wall bisynthesis [Brevinema andersonii]|uniref:Glycosyltransferase involved in cell wall bisynthesis n=1 Tax=Brevinema andersonii TaxID=34097 RepID=A0A1I1DY64_BREAD|nr:glycosyltransferase [Brevinema andersonii]SFB79875.1 Glycosyltransferase involved in cell wall bisynthesis [Brevinema andersonii]
MKTALVHDWLVTMGGAECVLEQMYMLYPQAPIYTLFSDPKSISRTVLKDAKIINSSLQHCPFIRKIYRKIPQLFPLAIEEFDMRGYNVVLSSSHAVAKGVLTDAKTCHISYVHTPMRYIWDLTHEYLKQAKFPWLLEQYTKHIFHGLRQWDIVSSFRPDYYIANSHFIKNRIHKIYRRDAEVIYPPVNLSEKVYTDKENYFVAASRHVPYKNILLITESFARMPDKKLIILGDGPDSEKVRRIANKAENISYLGYQPHSELMSIIGKAKAFIFAAEEDFGLMPVEAQSLGTPVIAYGVGGACETIQNGVTGIFFYSQTAEAITQAVQEFEHNEDRFDPQKVAEYSKKFSICRFQEEMKAFIDKKFKEFHSKDYL